MSDPQTAAELFIEALQIEMAELYRMHERAVGALVFYKELCSVAMERMYDAESERDKLRVRIREVMGLNSDKERQESDGPES